MQLLASTIISAYLLVNCDKEKKNQVLNDIQQIDQVKEIQKTVGVYDIIAKIESDALEYLDKLLSERIRSIPNIRSVMMLHCKGDME